MRFVSWTLCALSVAGCATARAVPTAGDGRSQLSGTIVVPEDYQGNPADFCDQIELRPTVANGVPVGHALVQSQSTYCVYSVRDLPVNMPVNVMLGQTGLLPCMGGKSVSLKPTQFEVKLAQQETRVSNVDASCGG